MYNYVYQYNILGLTIKSWGNQEVDYVVVTTKGISSPLPGEVFTETMGLVNNTFFPFVSVMEPMRNEVEVNPEKLKLPPKQHQEYILTIKAPEEIGYYIDKIKKEHILIYCRTNFWIIYIQKVRFCL